MIDLDGNHNSDRPWGRWRRNVERVLKLALVYALVSPLILGVLVIERLFPTCRNRVHTLSGWLTCLRRGFSFGFFPLAIAGLIIVFAAQPLGIPRRFIHPSLGFIPVLGGYLGASIAVAFGGKKVGG